MMHRFTLRIRTRAIAFEGSADVYGQSDPEDSERLLRDAMAGATDMKVELSQTMEEV